MSPRDAVSFFTFLFYDSTSLDFFLSHCCSCLQCEKSLNVSLLRSVGLLTFDLLNREGDELISRRGRSVCHRQKDGCKMSARVVVKNFLTFHCY